MVFVIFRLWDINGEEEAGPIAIAVDDIASFYQNGHDTTVCVIVLKTAGRAFYVRAGFDELADQLVASGATLSGSEVQNG